MIKSFKKVFKKATTPAICAALLMATMGMTAFAAASGTLTGSLNNNVGTAKLTNTSGNTRYCTVAIREYNATTSNSSIVSSNAGNISNGNSISTSGTITKNHAQGVGVIYNSAAPESGAATTKYTTIK